MQPLMDNLEAQTYETFEKDTMKYIQVLAAMHLILLIAFCLYMCCGFEWISSYNYY